MSASFDSKRFFEDAEKFFTELQTSIDTQHSEQKKSQAKELDTLKRLLEERIASAQDVIQEQHTKIEKLSTTQTQQTQFIQELTRQIRELNERIEVLSTAAATIVPAPVVQPIQPNEPIQAPAADAEQESAAPAGSTSKKATKPKAPKSPDKEAAVAAIPESEPTAPPIVTAVTSEVAVVQTPEITADQAPAVEPTIEAMPVAEQSTLSPNKTNAQIVELFLSSETVQSISDKLGTLPISTPKQKKHVNALKALAAFDSKSQYPNDVFEFALHSWLIALLLRGKHENKKTPNDYFDEITGLFNKPNVVKHKEFAYPDNTETVKVSLKLATMMSSDLSATFIPNPKKYIFENKDVIRIITKSIENHCEGSYGADDSQVWITFLNKWLNQTKE
jgi:hypothetical protein